MTTSLKHLMPIKVLAQPHLYTSTHHLDQAHSYLIIRPHLHKSFRRTDILRPTSALQVECKVHLQKSGCRKASLLDLRNYYVMHMCTCTCTCLGAIPWPYSGLRESCKIWIANRHMRMRASLKNQWRWMRFEFGACAHFGCRPSQFARFTQTAVALWIGATTVTIFLRMRGLRFRAASWRGMSSKVQANCNPTVAMVLRGGNKSDPICIDSSPGRS